MARFKEKLKAQQLRRKGWSIGSIAKELKVSKGSASTWCQDIELTKQQKELLLRNAIAAGHKGRIIGAEMNRRKKLAQIEFYKTKAQQELPTLSEKEWLVAGVALYWGEGSKTNQLAFSNSDPRLIKFMKCWFEKVMKVEPDDFMPRISINESHRDRIEEVIKFWSDYLGLPVAQFGNPYFVKVKQKKVYENHNSYYGVVSLKVRKSTEMKYHILGLITALGDQGLEPG